MIVKQSVVMFLAAAVSISLCAAPSLAEVPAKIPDFTQGDKTDGSHDWTLGPTGAGAGFMRRKHTADARQILITQVAKAHPPKASWKSMM